MKDFFAVDPAYGTWEDIARLGADFDLMFDAVFNHVSAQSEWFQRFLARRSGVTATSSSPSRAIPTSRKWSARARCRC